MVQTIFEELSKKFRLASRAQGFIMCECMHKCPVATADPQNNLKTSLCRSHFTGPPAPSSAFRGQQRQLVCATLIRFHDEEAAFTALRKRRRTITPVYINMMEAKRSNTPYRRFLFIFLMLCAVIGEYD